MKTLSATNHDAAKALAAAVRAGNVGVFVTDTVYGIGCRADDVKAIKRIYRLKKRADPKLPLLVSSLHMAKRYVRVSKRNEALLRRHWPGALTAVLPSKQQLPYLLEGGTGALAVRVPDDAWLRGVIRRLGVPLVATSANISGQQTIENEQQLRAQFKRLPDVFVDGGNPRSRKPSTLVDLMSEKPVIVRAGAVVIKT